MDVDGSDRLRSALLAAVGVAALLLAGWWWRAGSPADPPPGTWVVTGIGPDGSSRLAGVWRVDPATGDVVAVAPRGDADRQEEAAGAELRLDGDAGAGVGSGYGYPGGRSEGDRNTLWAERTTLHPGEALLRQAPLARGESRLLRFSCTGPGELLVIAAGARAADPMTVGCDGAVATVEITGTGGPAGVSFSPAGAAPVELVARLTRG